MKYRGVIFDFNGVLLLDGDLHEIAWQKSISEISHGKLLSQEEIQRFVHGRNNREVFEIFLQRKVEGDELEFLSERKEGYYRALCLKAGDKFQLNKDAIDLFAFLKENNIHFTIATASGKSNLDFFVEHLKLDNWFDISKIVYDNGSIPGKPKPDFYLLAAQKINVSSQQCIVIEDSISGITAAKAAGIGLVAGYGHKDKHQELLMHGADDAIDSLSVLKEKMLGFPRMRCMLGEPQAVI